MNKLQVENDNLDFTVMDWLSAEEKKKLVEALTSAEGYTLLAITKNRATSHDIYYVNGVEVFKRNIK